MKIKTFILTFLLMMMSSPIIFGQSRASVTTDVSNWEGLKEALTVFNTGQDESEITVRLTADINIPADEAPIEIKAGKNVTLNLNGYVIKAASTKYVFNNLGNLTIHDGGDEKNSAIEGRGIFNGRTTGDGQLINRDAKLTIQNGIFRSTSTDGGAAIHNYGIADIQGGSFYAEYAAIANFGEMTINNARIIGENYAINNDSTLTIGNTYYYGTIDTGDLTAEVNPAVYTVSPEGSVKPFEAYLYVKDFYYNTSEDYYMTVAEAVSKINSYKDTPKEATLTLLVNTEISNEILISNNATVNLNNKKVTFEGGDQSRFKVTADVTFKNGTIEGPQRCVYTYSDGKDVALNLENVNLTTTGTTGYQQPLTIAGTAEAETTTVDLKNVKIDAGNATGYGIISFVKTMLTADEDTEVSGYAALYAKDNSLGTTGSAGSEFVFNGSTLIGNGGKEGEANSFSTIALHESNVTVKMNGGVAKSLGGNHAILGIGWTGEPIETGNTIVLDAEMDVTGGSQYLYMANANTNTVVVRSEYVDPSWSTAAYGDLVQVKGIAVAKIGDVKYCSLAEAVEAAAADATIELLNADVDESAATVTINKKLNLKGEGIDKYKFPQIKLEGTANVSVAGTSYHPTTFEYFNVTVGELAQFIVKGYSTVNGTFVNNGSITLNTSTIGGNITNNKNIVVRNASDIIASEYSGNGTINLENVRMSATKLSGVGSVVATGTNDIVASTISARSFKVENEAVVNLNDNAYVNGITNGSTMTVNGTLNVTNSAVWYLNVNLAEASKLKVTGKHTINNTSIKNKEFIVNTQMNVADGAEIFVASDAVLTAKKAVVAEDAVVALNFYANVTFTETVNNGTINLYLNEGKTFTTPEITEGLNPETEYGCIVSYENNAYKAIRILNEGDVAVIAETGIGYETLQDAIDACGTGNSTINLLADITEDATVSQAENKNIIIDGKEFKYSGTIYIHGNARHTGAETLTIQNVNFTTEEASHDFISSNSTGAVERYAHNVTVKDCNFTSTYTGEEKNEVVAMRFRQAYNINVIGGEFTNLHSVMQANGNTGTNFEGVKANCIEGVFSMTGGGENSSYSIKNSEFTSQGYGIRVGEGYNKNFNIEGCTITAPVPVAVRYAENGGPLYFTFGQNTMNSDNPYNYWFVAGTGKDEYDGGETLPEIGGQVVVNIDEDSDLGYEGVYGNYGVAQIGNVKYQSFEEAVAAADNNDVIVLLPNKVGADDKPVPTVMKATVYGKNITVTTKDLNDPEKVNVVLAAWEVGALLVGRGGEGENGDAILTFDNAKLTSFEDTQHASGGFNISGRKAGDNSNVYTGKLILNNSEIAVSYLRQVGDAELTDSKLTVIGGFSVAGRKAAETGTNEDSKATMTLINSEVSVVNMNGMGIGYSATEEGIGEVNLDATSKFSSDNAFLVGPKGTLNIAGEATIAAGKTLTNNGTINLTNTNAKLYTTTTGLSIKTDLTGYKANYYAATDEEAAHYKLLSNDEFNFVIKDSDGNIVNGYTTFPRAIDAAQDGQTVEIRTNGPIILGSDKTGGVVGKTVTVKAGEGFAPVKYDNNNRDMLVGNGAKVIFDGVEFIPRYELDDNTKESGFVVNNGGIVEFVNGADITADYITVNEGGIININNSNVNVNGTFINNNVVNVEGTSDIYMETSLHENSPLGDGYFHMNGVTMNNSYVKGVKVIFNGENNNIGSSSTFTGSLLDIAEGAEVNVSGNASFTSNISGSVGISKIEGRLNLTSSKSAVFNNLRLAGVIEVGEESNLKIGSTLYKNEGANIILNPQYATVNLQEGHLDIFTSNEWDYEVVYNGGVYSLAMIEYNFIIADAEGNQHYDADHHFMTFEEALANVQDGETIHITTGATGDEHSVEIDYNEEIEFTITGEAPDYKLPTVTFQNTTVNIVNSNITIAELDARQDATINVIDSDVKTCGNGSADGIAKSYYNGRIVIDNSTVYAHQATTMGYIDIINGGKLNVTWQTNVYGNGLITVEGENTTDPQNIVKSTLQTAAFNLTGQPYNDRDNTDEDRVGKPATVVVDGAVLIAGDVTNNNGANYSYEVDSYGINIGTIEGKAALLDIKNGSSVEFAMNPTGNHSFKSPVIGANGTVNIDASTLVVKNRIANSTDICKLQNNGVVYVTGASDINASVEGDGWFYMNGVTMSAATELLGAKVRFASGTNNLVGSTIDDGYFQVGIGAYEGVDENVDTDNGVIVNVSDNANVGASGVTYAGWIGTGFYDSEEDKAAAMTEGVKYVLNINNSIAEFGYFHVSNDGELNVNGNAANKVNYNSSSYTFYAGDFIINGTAKFEATDVLASYTKVSCDNGTDNPGTLNIINTEYEAERHNGAVAGINFDVRKTGVVNVQGADTELYLNEYTSIAKDAKFNVKENANVTALGTITNNGTINVEAGTMTTGTAQIAAIDNKSTGAITVAQGSTLKANTNINNSGTLTVNGTLVADAQLNTTGTVTVNGNLNRTANAVNEINVNGGKMDVKGEVAANKINNNADFNVLDGGTVDVTYFQINADVDVTTPNYFFVGNNVTGNATFKMNNVALTAYSQLMYAKINFAGENTLTNANLTNSNVTVISGATLKVPHVQNMLNNTIKVTSLTNNGILEVGNGNAKVDATTVTNNATATVNGTLTATTELYNAANATINGSGNIKADASTVIDLTNNGVIEGDLTISAKTINNYNKIDVAEIVATDFYNTNMTYSSVIVDDATLQSVSFTNSGTVNVSGESVVKITNEVSDSGQFVMEGVNLTSSNTNLHGAYIVFNGENSATNLTFSGRNDVLTGSGIQVNGTLNIYGEVTANRLGTGEGTVVLKETNSKLTANSGLAIYPEDPAFVTPYDKDIYHVVESPAVGTSMSVYTLKSNDAYVAMVNGNYYETIAGAIEATGNATDITVTIVRGDIEENVIVEGKNITFVSAEDVNDVFVTGNLTVSSTVNFSAFNVTFADVNLKAGAAMNIDHATFTATQIATKGQNANIYVGEGSVVNAHIRVQHTGTNIDIDGTVNASSVYVSPNEINNYSINLGAHEATLVTATEGLNVETDYADHKVSYKNGMYQLVGKYVAQIDDVKYETLADALVAVPSNGTVELLWEEGNDPIVMAGILTGKNATIKQAVSTDTIYVDWSKGWLFIARGAEYNNGPSTLTFEGVNLYSVNDGVGTDNNRYGINVSAKRKNTENYNGTLVIKDSYVELSYLYNAYEATFDNSTVTLVNANGMNVGGLLGAYTTTGQAGTATLNIENGTTFNVTNITIGYDGIGIMNVDATSAVNTEPQYGLNVIEGGYLNTYGNFDGYSQFNLVDDGIVNVYSGLYSFDVNVYCVEGVAAFELPNGYWEVRETHGTQTRELAEAGWYWFSSYISDLEGTTGLQLLQSELNPNGKQIKGQFAFTNYFGSRWSTGGLQSVTTAQMYMLNTTAPVTLDFEGEFVDYSNTPIVLNPGWNWIGFPVRYAQTVEVALANLQPKHGDIIKGKQGSSTYYVTDEFEGWFPELILEPGHGHMYYSTSDETVTFVFNSNGQPAESKRATAAMYWNVNETAYPSNMTMIATTDIEGGDYEVAAFVNGEVRGSARPIYVEALDAYVLVLTIQGNDVEEMTFRYYDIATGEEMSFSNRINYTNDAIIGSMAEPYKLTRGTTGIGEVALSDVNIYPNPTTTGVQVNLDATCEKVEIFNALGVKVAEYQNVDSIDAFETAGIYVIRLTNGGEIKHTRLVVR